MNIGFNEIKKIGFLSEIFNFQIKKGGSFKWSIVFPIEWFRSNFILFFLLGKKSVEHVSSWILIFLTTLYWKHFKFSFFFHSFSGTTRCSKILLIEGKSSWAMWWEMFAFSYYSLCKPFLQFIQNFGDFPLWIA